MAQSAFRLAAIVLGIQTETRCHSPGTRSLAAETVFDESQSPSALITAESALNESTSPTGRKIPPLPVAANSSSESNTAHRPRLNRQKSPWRRCRLPKMLK